MNSRDKLTKLANYFYNDENPSFDTMQYFKDIDNDLEILEILKKRLNIKIPYGSVKVISVNNNDDYLLFEVELKEHTKIEEWLERKE